MKKHRLSSFNLRLEEIESIEYMGEEDTIDICVEDTHMFFANNIYVHNSGSDKDIVENNDISGAYAKLFAVDLVLTVSRRAKDKMNKTARVHIPKSRLGPDGMTFPCKFDTDNGVIEIFHEKSESGKKVQKEMVTNESYEKQQMANKWQQLMNSQRQEPTDLF